MLVHIVPVSDKCQKLSEAPVDEPADDLVFPKTAGEDNVLVVEDLDAHATCLGRGFGMEGSLEVLCKRLRVAVQTA